MIVFFCNEKCNGCFYSASKLPQFKIQSNSYFMYQLISTCGSENICSKLKDRYPACIFPLGWLFLIPLMVNIIYIYMNNHMMNLIPPPTHPLTNWLPPPLLYHNKLSTNPLNNRKFYTRNCDCHIKYLLKYNYSTLCGISSY